MIQEVKKAVKIINNGGIILYPTDTVWGIGCDANNPDAIKRVFKIKKRNSKKGLICIMKDLRMLENHVLSLPKNIESVIKKRDPITIIYENPINISKILIADDNTLAIRIPKNKFCNLLITDFGKPIVSTSANISESKTPSIYSEIEKSILEGVDHIVNLHKEKKCGIPSKIFKIQNNGNLLKIR